MPPLYEFGQFRLDANGPLVFRDGLPVPLPPKVAETLAALVERAGQVVSKEELLRKVWPETFIEEGSLTRTISILRKALSSGGQEFITTLPKRGYLFAAEVKETPEDGPESCSLMGGSANNTPSTGNPAPCLVKCDFRLTERICRKLDRATLDPLIIGDHLRYVDNQVRSDVLVFFLHGLGLDHSDFEPVLTRLPYRGISPTLYGCEPERRGRISLPLGDHVVILRELLRDLAASMRPALIVVVGFSLGADLGFDLILGPDEPDPSIAAFLAQECNLCFDTCVISRVLAGLPPEYPAISVADLQRLGESATSPEQWLNIHEYLVKVLRKFQGDIGVLQRASADLVKPLRECPGFEIFARRFLAARERLRILRIVFPCDSWSTAALARLRLENLDRGILGMDFPENEIRISAKKDHFELMSPDYVLCQIDELVAGARAHCREAPA